MMKRTKKTRRETSNDTPSIRIVRDKGMPNLIPTKFPRQFVNVRNLSVALLSAHKVKETGVLEEARMPSWGEHALRSN
eukprot:7111403-Pyramimonas_sp.AAC.1